MEKKLDCLVGSHALAPTGYTGVRVFGEVIAVDGAYRRLRVLEIVGGNVGELIKIGSERTELAERMTEADASGEWCNAYPCFGACGLRH